MYKMKSMFKSAPLGDGAGDCRSFERILVRGGGTKNGLRDFQASSRPRKWKYFD